MRTSLTFRESLLVGSLMFGLCFGAGNLIFPIFMGRMAGAEMWIANLGFIITGVGIPVIGYIAMALSKNENMHELSSPVCRSYATMFTLLLYLAIGPAFASPRTGTVSFEVGVRPFISDGYTDIGLLVFSALFFGTVLFFSLRPGRILDWVGKYLTPAFLVVLSVLLAAVIFSPMGDPSAYPAQGPYIEKAFTTGLLDGYNTMDGLACLAFGLIVVKAVHALGVTEPKYMAKEITKSGVICFIAMSAIYTALTFMGGSSLGSIPTAENGAQAMTLVSRFYFSMPGQVLLAFIVTLACLKTSIGLVTACSQIFNKMFPALSYNTYAYIFAGISFFVANFGLVKIIQWSIPVLMFLYPLAITIIILALLYPFIGKSRAIYGMTTLLTMFAAFFDLMNAMPKQVASTEFAQGMIAFAKTTLPGFDYGFGWLAPALAGFIIGILLDKTGLYPVKSVR